MLDDGAEKPVIRSPSAEASLLEPEERFSESAASETDRQVEATFRNEKGLESRDSSP
jgi:hypothetical protein